MNVGSELRRARQARGLSIETLAATTRIQARVLDGIERNDLSVVPPRPYARGFVAAYAREVGLNPDQTVREYFAQFEIPQGPPAEDTPAEAPSTGPNNRPVMVLFALSVLLVSALVLMRAPGPVAPQDPDVVGTTGTVEMAFAESLTPPAVAPVTASPDQPGDGIVAVLEVDDPAWIAATADGTRVLYRTLEPGARETVRARRDITIRVGNAGAVRLSIDGGAAAPMGRLGEVRTVTLRARIPHP